jgi:hypothetical protein
MTKNEFFPTLVVFAVTVLGALYAPVPNWLKVLVLVVDVITILLSTALIYAKGEQNA